MNKFLYLTVAILLLTTSLSEAKRSLGRGSSSRGSSSSSSYSRRTSSVTSRPAATSRPASSHSNSHADASKLSYPNYNSQPNRVSTGNTGSNTGGGWVAPSSQNKAVGPPPSYSASNPAGGAKTNQYERPPSYSNTPVRAQTQRPLQSGASYPRQPQPIPAGSYPHNVPSNAGPPKYYPVGSAPSVGYHPAGSMSGGYRPQTGATYYPVGAAPGVGYHPAGGYHPQSPPIYAGSNVQPGYYPAGTFQQKNSGPGLGTGLIAGALGGAILGHALTPTGNNYGSGHNYNSGGGGGGGSSDSDRVIIINNTPGQPATVTTANGNQPVVINNPQQPDAPVPLAPFQPGSTQEVNQQPSMSQPASPVAASPPLVHSPNTNEPSSNTTYPEGTVPLAPLQQGQTEPPKSGGVMCYPVLVNITSETDPTNVTTVEQIACYEVPAGFDPNAPAAASSQNPSDPTTMGTQKPDLMKMPGGDMSVTQKMSTATLAESAQIKQNGANGKYSTWSIISSSIASLLVAYCLQ